jgi:hypothetical protein
VATPCTTATTGWRLLLDAQHQPAAAGKQLAMLGRILQGHHLGQVVPGTEGPTGAAQHDHATCGVLRQLAERGIQRVQHGCRQGIEPLGRIERERGAAACVIFAQHQRGRRGRGSRGGKGIRRHGRSSMGR